LLAIRFSWHALPQRMGRIFRGVSPKRGGAVFPAPPDSIRSTFVEAARSLD
jgi:hypothetical protein